MNGCLLMGESLLFTGVYGLAGWAPTITKMIKYAPRRMLVPSSTLSPATLLRSDPDFILENLLEELKPWGQWRLNWSFDCTQLFITEIKRRADFSRYLQHPIRVNDNMKVSLKTSVGWIAFLFFSFLSGCFPSLQHFLSRYFACFVIIHKSLAVSECRLYISGSPRWYAPDFYNRGLQKEILSFIQ